ncbi:hydroxymethylglutaryl-CoA lyase [Metabacillus fastidiosus]|uniref:hydroxymethylglutaryl-CoA lyase n=1 Tax=Metabacillus fastidiosus TaxID=1458 RepID=UPI002DBD871F|nr:hydroxymethylglutaryl-CoA lyase [Metabacillus fastidiosus]MEC2077144.1 hydroxymethylglutaryl-CoA lyase [Metabacillus fastidiosus]
MIDICEVGPRDGLQNEKKLLSAEAKVELITKLIDAGITYIEVTSFVNPKVIPQMADAEDVLMLLPKKENVRYAGLILSRSGLERALRTDINYLHTAVMASDTFNFRNAKRTTDENVRELEKIIQDSIQANIDVTAVIGTAFGCPFEGKVPLLRVLKISEKLLHAGCSEIILADTTGMANPRQVQNTVRTFYDIFGKSVKLGLHFHNTRGLGLANILAGYQAGVTRFDSSIAGLGGCPFAPKAVGNVCTEDMVNMFHSMDIQTNTNLEKLIDSAKWIERQMNRTLNGMLMKSGIAKY